MTQLALAAHHPSHRSLLRHPKFGTGRLDAIVVPASRPAAELMPAMELAAALRCHFLALCSGRVSPDEAAGLAAEVPDLSWTVVGVHEDSADHLLRFGTGGIREAADSRVGDLSRKRNIGLLLAHLAGWHGVLFLDDDIRDLSPGTVRTAASVLSPGRAVGMIAAAFPDNSVVCHASRLSGRSQDVFVSGSALAVDTTEIASFFPEVYNEDWLFLYDLVRFRRVSAAGVVRQAAYLPYADPTRATREEFGDVLAEGLMSLLHGRLDVETAFRAGYWQQAIAQRHVLLDDVTARLGRCEDDDRDAALRAVQAARTVLGQLDGEVLSTFVRRWREDVRDWRARLAELTPTGCLPAALDALGIRGDSRSAAAGVDLAPARHPVLTAPDGPDELAEPAGVPAPRVDDGQRDLADSVLAELAAVG